MTEERWPGEDRISTTEEDEGGTEAPEADASPADAEAAEGAGEPAPPEEQLEADENGEAEQRRDGDTPVPDDEPPPEPHALRMSNSIATREKDIIRKRGLGFLSIVSSYKYLTFEELGYPHMREPSLF